MADLYYRKGVGFKGIGSVKDFDDFEAALIKHCDRKDREPIIPKIGLVVKPRLREVIEVNKSKVS